ncbi:MAG: hypothetical protein PHT95_04440 [Candidatus Omnitrophica bacterium]|nr:hypothetical protein [Candidatus Omnitrophota bacterium]
MKNLLILMIAVIFFPASIGRADDTLPRESALRDFDDEVNGATTFVDTVPPLDRSALETEERENRYWAMHDDLWSIDDELWYEHLRRKGAFSDD